MQVKKLLTASSCTLLIAIIGVVLYFVMYKAPAPIVPTTVPSPTPVIQALVPSSTPIVQPPAALPAALPAVSSPVTWLGLGGYDFPGNDIGTSQHADTAQACANSCATQSGCVAAMYSPSTSTCWNKSSLGVPIVNTDRIVLVPPLNDSNPVNAWKLHDKTDHGGDDIACFQHGEGQAQCAALCANLANCNSYNVVSAGAGAGWPGCCVKKAPLPIITNPNDHVQLWTM